MRSFYKVGERVKIKRGNKALLRLHWSSEMEPLEGNTATIISLYHIDNTYKLSGLSEWVFAEEWLQKIGPIKLKDLLDE